MARKSQLVENWKGQTVKIRFIEARKVYGQRYKNYLDQNNIETIEKDDLANMRAFLSPIFDIPANRKIYLNTLNKHKTESRAAKAKKIHTAFDTANNALKYLTLDELELLLINTNKFKERRKAEKAAEIQREMEENKKRNEALNARLKELDMK